MVRAAFVAVVAIAVVAAMPAAGGVRKATASQSATVTITDARIAVSPASLRTGVATFVAVNKGRKLHSFAIAGPGVSVRTAKLQAGRSARLTVNLHSGRYTLWDPVALGRKRAQTIAVKPTPPPKVERVELPPGELGPNYSCDDDFDDVVC